LARRFTLSCDLLKANRNSTADFDVKVIPLGCMTEDDQEQALEHIRHLVWSGFYDADRIVVIVCDEIFEQGEIDRALGVALVAAELESKLAEEQTWPHPTDCDRLDEAFHELNGKNIISLQNAGYTQSDGLDDVSEIWNNGGAHASPIIGYCFYHGQDLERAVNGEGLMLTFGDINGTDERGIEVGRIITEVLAAKGLKVVWDGTISKRILLPEIQWRRKTPVAE